jgi:hypothetical protein
MPPRHRNLSTLRRLEENRGNENIPPHPPPFYAGVHPAMAQFMADTNQ